MFFVPGNAPVSLTICDGLHPTDNGVDGGGPGGGPLEGAEGPGDHLPGRGHGPAGLRHQQQQPRGQGESPALVQGGQQPGRRNGITHLQDRRQDQQPQHRHR